MNSPFHIFLASFSGIGGECAPTEAAPLERGLAGGGSKLDRGVLGVSVSPLLEGPGMADKLDMMLLAALSCVAPDVAIDAIGMLCSAADCGTSPPLGKLIESPLLTGVNTLVLQATNTGVRRPGYEARVWALACIGVVSRTEC